jgi:hypothetical protein
MFSTVSAPGAHLPTDGARPKSDCSDCSERTQHTSSASSAPTRRDAARRKRAKTVAADEALGRVACDALQFVVDELGATRAYALLRQGSTDALEQFDQWVGLVHATSIVCTSLARRARASVDVARVAALISYRRFVLHPDDERLCVPRALDLSSSPTTASSDDVVATLTKRLCDDARRQLRALLGATADADAAMQRIGRVRRLCRLMPRTQLQRPECAVLRGTDRVDVCRHLLAAMQVELRANAMRMHPSSNEPLVIVGCAADDCERWVLRVAANATPTTVLASLDYALAQSAARRYWHELAKCHLVRALVDTVDTPTHGAFCCGGCARVHYERVLRSSRVDLPQIGASRSAGVSLASESLLQRIGRQADEALRRNRCVRIEAKTAAATPPRRAHKGATRDASILRSALLHAVDADATMLLVAEQNARLARPRRLQQRLPGTNYAWREQCDGAPRDVVLWTVAERIAALRTPLGESFDGRDVSLLTTRAQWPLFVARALRQAVAMVDEGERRLYQEETLSTGNALV